MDQERLVAAARNSAAERGSQRTSETPRETWLGGAWKGSLWLCFAGPLPRRHKSGISGNRQRPKPTPRERNSLGKLGEEEKRISDKTKEKVHNIRFRFG